MKLSLITIATLLALSNAQECEDEENPQCTELRNLDEINCNPNLAAFCPETCGVCNLPCQDDDSLVEFLNPLTDLSGQSLGGDCESMSDKCNHPIHGNFFRLFCPITCGECTPELPPPYACYDQDDALRQFTSQQTLSCDFVESNGLCSTESAFFTSYCPTKCGICGRNCQDNDAAVLSLQIDPITTCAQVADAGFCNVQFFDLIFGLYCPVSCNTECVDGKVPQASPSPSTSPASLSPSPVPPSPSPVIPSPSLGVASATSSPSPQTVSSNDSKEEQPVGIIVAAVLIAGSAVALLGFMVLRRRNSTGARGRVYPRSDEEEVEMESAQKIIE